MYCKECGKQINDNSKFCSSCGTKQSFLNISDVNHKSYREEGTLSRSGAFNRIRRFVISIGIILIVLRMFFPVKEFVVESDGVRLDTSKWNKATLDSFGEKFEKEIAFPKTVLQACGIGVLTIAFMMMSDPKKH